MVAGQTIDHAGEPNRIRGPIPPSTGYGHAGGDAQGVTQPESLRDFRVGINFATTPQADAEKPVTVTVSRALDAAVKLFSPL